MIICQWLITTGALYIRTTQRPHLFAFNNQAEASPFEMSSVHRTNEHIIARRQALQVVHSVFPSQTTSFICVYVMVFFVFFFVGGGRFLEHDLPNYIHLIEIAVWFV